MPKPSLRDMARRKPEPERVEESYPETASPAATEEVTAKGKAKSDGRKGVLVRLTPESWHMLGVLAGELTVETGDRHTKQSLMTEALNDLLKKNGKPPIA